MTDKKADTWMPLWIGAYLADTMKLTTIQHGAYFLLLIAYWRERAPLVDDDDELRSITKLERAEWKKNRPVLAKFFRVADGVWWHKRVEQEIAAAEARAKKASGKAKKAAEARWVKDGKQSSGNAPSMLQALPEDMLDECPPPSPIPSPSETSEANASAAADAAASVPDGDRPEPPAPPPEKSPEDLTREEVWRTGKRLVMETDEVSRDTAGSFLGGLVQRYTAAVVLLAVRSAAVARPPKARDYLTATCQRLKGERADAPTVPSDAAEKTQAYLASQELTEEQKQANAERARALRNRGVPA